MSEVTSTETDVTPMSHGALRGYALVMALTMRDLCVAAKIDMDTTSIKTPEAEGSESHVLTISQLVALAKYI